jgi:hypothetical protein
MAVYGYPSALVGATDEDVPMLQVWSVPDALRAVAEQTAVFVEDQFRDVFNPRERAAAGAEALSAWTAGDAAANTSVVSTPGPADKDKAADGLATIDEKDDDGSFYTARENGDPDPDDTGDGRHPSFSFTLQGAYDEPAFQTYSVNDEGRRESVSVPILSVSHFT